MKTVQEKGYTILELMIVLSVSVGMFGIVATTFGGRQQQVQFTQAVRDFDSRLKDLKNDVSVGFYPANDSITCTSTGGINPAPSFNINLGVADDLGSNAECISIGKVLQFSPEVPTEFNADSDQIMKIFNVVGLRRDANGNNPITVNGAVPTAAPGPEVVELKWGLRVKRVMYVNNLLSQTYGIALFSELNRGSQFQASASNEAVQTSLMYSSLAVELSEADMTDSISSPIRSITDTNFDNASEIVICVTDADDDRRATITFGGDRSGSVIDFDNFNVAVCA